MYWESIPEYAGWFKEVYKDEKITINNVADALAAFEDTLTTPNSRFAICGSEAMIEFPN